jgi:hypothetical protein
MSFSMLLEALKKKLNLLILFFFCEKRKKGRDNEKKYHVLIFVKKKEKKKRRVFFFHEYSFRDIIREKKLVNDESYVSSSECYKIVVKFLSVVFEESVSKADMSNDS